MYLIFCREFGLCPLWRLNTAVPGFASPPKDRSPVSPWIRGSKRKRHVSHYDPQQLYPVHIGDIFNNRYRVTGKLGYGSYSTSWLCQDIRYVQLVADASQASKVFRAQGSTSPRKFPTATNRVFKIYQHFNNVQTDHPAQSLIRQCHDAFELQRDGSSYRCLVLEPMHMILLEMMGLNPEPFNLSLLKMTMSRVPRALTFCTPKQMSFTLVPLQTLEPDVHR